MTQLRLIPIAVFTVALLGGPGLPTFSPSVGTALAQEEEEEIMQTRGKKKSQGQVSKPGVEKKAKKKTVKKKKATKKKATGVKGKKKTTKKKKAQRKKN